MNHSNQTGSGSKERSDAPGMTFPCEVDIKVFAPATDRFEPLVRQLLSRHLAGDQIIEVRLRESTRGKYHSLSCRVLAGNRQELDRVFRELTAHPDILMVI